MTKNYMKEVAQLLGVELEEEFKIKGGLHKHRITLNGLEYFHIQANSWLLDSSYNFKNLITGDLIIEKPILDQKEKEYLSAVIKPFRDSVFGIVKYKQYINRYEYITISIKEKSGDHFHMNLPSFKVGTMYKGMQLGKEYTLKELGL